jgi:hypothetical protein
VIFEFHSLACKDVCRAFPHTFELTAPEFYFEVNSAGFPKPISTPASPIPAKQLQVFELNLYNNESEDIFEIQL